MATREQIAAALVNAHEAGDVEAARKLAQAYQSFDAPEKEEKGTVFDSMGSGLTAGLSDEIAGAVGAIPAAIHTGDWNLGNHYRGIRDQARENQNAFAERNPGTAFAAEMAGGLLTGGAGLARVGVRQAVNTLPRLAGAGAGVGAVAGFGHSEAEGLGGMAQDTAVGAGTGAVGGVLLPPVASAIGRGVTAPFRHAQATRAARPTAKVGQAIARDDLTTDKIAAKLKKLPAGASIADAGGESLQTLARDITVQPGKARNIGRALFEGRRKLAPQRIDSAVRSALDTRGKFHEAKGMLARRMKEDAKPFYEEAYSRPLRMTPELKAVLERPAMRDAVQAGMKMARNEGGVIQGHVQTLDYAKRALDDQIGTAIRKGDNQLARALQGTKRALVSEMDRQVPAYRKAREAFAGPAALDDALDSGRKFMREDAEDLADAIENLSLIHI